MDARRFAPAAIAALALCSLGASYRTTNFVVNAPTPQLAKEIGDMAEHYRRELAKEWLGKEMPPWGKPCMLTAQVAPNLGAGGATSFVFDGGEVFGWRMTIQGSRQRILDSVLPHEVTHTIFACHFRQALPRWADEGACTTVEHPSEKAKQKQMLITFLKTGRGISFSKMFAMKEYPRDVMPLYSQGYSLARFLIAQGGKKKYLEFLEDGLQDENWPRAVHKHYGQKDLLALQNVWLGWVKQGSPDITPTAGAATLAAADRKAVVRGQSSDDVRPSGRLVAVPPAEAPGAVAAPERAAPVRASLTSAAKWKPAGTSEYVSDGIAKPQAAGAREAVQPAGHQQMARPQPPQQAKQIILQWSHQDSGSVRR